MSNVIVKSIGYCVVRRALNIDSDAPSHLINGVFGVFNSVNDAEEFIFSVSDGSVHHTKIEHHYHDGEYFWSIHGVRTPTMHHEEKRHEPKKDYKIVQHGPYNTYSSWRVASKAHGGTRLEGNKDIAQYFDSHGFAVGEWDGAVGYIFMKKPIQYAVMLTEGKMNRYLSKKFFDKVLSGDPITTFPPSYLQTVTYAVDDHALAVEAMHQAKNILHQHPNIQFKVVNP